MYRSWCECHEEKYWKMSKRGKRKRKNDDRGRKEYTEYNKMKGMQTREKSSKIYE